jgi:hypothetical protein
MSVEIRNKSVKCFKDSVFILCSSCVYFNREKERIVHKLECKNCIRYPDRKDMYMTFKETS